MIVNHEGPIPLFITSGGVVWSSVGLCYKAEWDFLSPLVYTIVQPCDPKLGQKDQLSVASSAYRNSFLPGLMLSLYNTGGFLFCDSY